MAKSYKEIMNDITTFIFDVDGVLTDSSVFVSTLLIVSSLAVCFSVSSVIVSVFKWLKKNSYLFILKR